MSTPRLQTSPQHAIVIGNAGPNYSARVPDLRGCVATGATIDEVESELREAIEFRLDGLREDGSPMPQPCSTVRYVDVPAWPRDLPDARRSPILRQIWHAPVNVNVSPLANHAQSLRIDRKAEPALSRVGESA